jgi:hypothetical protein
MRANNRVSQPGNRQFEGNASERDFSLVQAASFHHRQASQARKLRAIYSQSPAQYIMNFQQFQKLSKRNKILTEHGYEKIFTRFDPVPDKRPKPKRKQFTTH